MNKKDTLYQRRATSPFVFDEAVSDVYEDMVRRSVPSYDLLFEDIQDLVAMHAHQHQGGYDLGAGTGRMSASVLESGLWQGNWLMLDNAAPMAARLVDVAKKHQNATVRCASVLDFHPPKGEASLVFLNFVLQFLPLNARDALIARIFEMLAEGGGLVFSEKTHHEDGSFQRFIQKRHHHFKKNEGYSQMEIEAKDASLEGVLITETMNAHEARLKGAGFSLVAPFLMRHGFVSWYARK